MNNKPNKVIMTIDVSKISKDKIIDRSFTKKDGTEVKVKDYKMELVPLNEKKMIKPFDTYTMWKTHIVTEAVSQEERKQGIRGNIIGEGIQIEFNN